jgi:hypothetical protein
MIDRSPHSSSRWMQSSQGLTPSHTAKRKKENACVITCLNVFFFFYMPCGRRRRSHEKISFPFDLFFGLIIKKEKESPKNKRSKRKGKMQRKRDQKLILNEMKFHINFDLSFFLHFPSFSLSGSKKWEKEWKLRSLRTELTFTFIHIFSFIDPGRMKVSLSVSD